MADELSARLSLDGAASEPTPWTNQRSSPRSDSAPQHSSANQQHSRQSSTSRGSKTTMDDIMATLQQLEADEQFSARKPAEKRMAWREFVNFSFFWSNRGSLRKCSDMLFFLC